MKSTFPRLGFHISFWALAYAFYFYLKLPLLGLSREITAVVILKDVIIVASIFYFLSAVIIPKLLLGKWLLFIVGLVLIYYFYATAIFLDFMLLPKIVDITSAGYLAYGKRVTAFGFWGILKFNDAAEILLDLTYMLAPALIVKLFVSLIKMNTQTLRLEKDNLNLELAFLKSQVNPHFLFNTLNNVYSLALHKSDLTADVVLKLSDLMRYTLYDSSAQKVPLNKEVKFFMNYIELERIRHSDRISISFERRGDYEGLVIAPLIIFQFIENAFKHGINNSFSKSWVKVDLNVIGSTLHLQIENSKFPTRSSPETGGIGLRNAKKRLQLLYPNLHKLEIKDDETIFLVYLSITLT